MKKVLGFVLAILILTSCTKEKSYTYEVTGTSGSYSVTLQNSDDNTQQWANVGMDGYTNGRKREQDGSIYQLRTIIHRAM